jgi:hypothetical protein
VRDTQHRVHGNHVALGTVREVVGRDDRAVLELQVGVDDLCAERVVKLAAHKLRELLREEAEVERQACRARRTVELQLQLHLVLAGGTRRAAEIGRAVALYAPGVVNFFKQRGWCYA